MKLLFVGLDDDYSVRFLESTAGIASIEIEHATSRTEADRYLARELVDVIVLNLDGIAVDGVALPSEAYKFLQTSTENSTSILTCCVTSESIEAELVNSLLNASRSADIWAVGEKAPTVNIWATDNLQNLIDYLKHQIEAVACVDAIVINSGGKILSLIPKQTRVLKIFANMLGGVSCNVEKLDGGLSSSRVFKIRVQNAQGHERISAVAKIDKFEKVVSESSKYQNEVSRLPVGAYAPHVGEVNAGASEYSGIFYRLLNSNDKPLYQVLLEDPDLAAEVVPKLQASMSPWHSFGALTQESIQSVRQQMIDDETVSELLVIYPELDWIGDFESKLIYIRKSCIHKDLHGGNVFVNSQNEPVLIDFADIGYASAVFDPITLELSLFTHPGTNEKLDWLPDFSTTPWFEIDSYLNGCPYADYIRACREWSHLVAGGDDAVCAGCYAYMLKQLKYKDVEPDLVLSLLRSVRATVGP